MTDVYLFFFSANVGFTNVDNRWKQQQQQQYRTTTMMKYKLKMERYVKKKCKTLQTLKKMDFLILTKKNLFWDILFVFVLNI